MRAALPRPQSRVDGSDKPQSEARTCAGSLWAFDTERGSVRVILDNIARALKEQNWLAAAIEFVIVIAGVVIGFQVNIWAEGQKTLAAERELLDRLHENVIAVQARHERMFLSQREELKGLYSARKLLFGLVERETLTPEECQFIGESHLPYASPIRVPVLDELLSSGTMGLISDPAVNAAIAGIFERQSVIEGVRDDIRETRTALSLEFPELIRYALVPTDDQRDEDGFDSAYVCDSDAMRSSPAFMNAVGENVTAYVTIFGAASFHPRDALADLRGAVGQALGLSEGER